jgi:uncharacterized protein (TIGR02145 family)
MKKNFFLFAILVGVTANAQVTHVEPVGANYSTKTVSFRVWWNAGSRDATHLSKVWVWVDYIAVNSNNTTSGNTWTRATVGTITGGTTSYDGDNRKGFWLEGNASTNYSATLTVQLTNVPNKFNWCAYISDYPPNVTAKNGTYTFKGTPPFTLIASNGTTTQIVIGKTLTASALTITPTIIRDKTECPGIFCAYTGSDLLIDASHSCQIRTSGAQNWVAWITDARDGKNYRIAQLSTGLWTMDDYLNYTGHSAVVTNELCSAADPNAKEYWRHTLETTYSTLCPAGWRLPTQLEYEITINNWFTYLQKGYVNTGKSVYNAVQGKYVCQPDYTSFVVSYCNGIRCYGQRTEGISHVQWQGTCSDSDCCCYGGVQPLHRFSGYARCVRDL